MQNTQAWAKDVDEKYAVQQKANELAASTKAGVASLWARVSGKQAEAGASTAN